MSNIKAMDTDTNTGPGGEGLHTSFPVPVPIPLDKDSEGPDYWQSHLDGWRKSGLSQAAYCRQHNLKYVNFRKWKERLSTYPTSTSIKLVEVRHDFSLEPGSSSGFSNATPNSGHPGINMMGAPMRNALPSGIRFWENIFAFFSFLYKIEKWARITFLKSIHEK